MTIPWAGSKCDKCGVVSGFDTVMNDDTGFQYCRPCANTVAAPQPPSSGNEGMTVREVRVFVDSVSKMIAPGQIPCAECERLRAENAHHKDTIEGMSANALQMEGEIARLRDTVEAYSEWHKGPHLRLKLEGELTALRDAVEAGYDQSCASDLGIISFTCNANEHPADALTRWNKERNNG